MTTDSIERLGGGKLDWPRSARPEARSTGKTDGEPYAG
jgi:hypothetical protein